MLFKAVCTPVHAIPCYSQKYKYIFSIHFLTSPNSSFSDFRKINFLIRKLNRIKRENYKPFSLMLFLFTVSIPSHTIFSTFTKNVIIMTTFTHLLCNSFPTFHHLFLSFYSLFYRTYVPPSPIYFSSPTFHSLIFPSLAFLPYRPAFPFSPQFTFLNLSFTSLPPFTSIFSLTLTNAPPFYFFFIPVAILVFSVSYLPSHPIFLIFVVACYRIWAVL